MPPILLAADVANSQTDARAALAAFDVAPRSLQGPASDDLAFYQIAIIDSAGATDAAAAFARRWRSQRGADAPLLWLGDASGWQAGADAVLPRPFSPDALKGQIEALRRQAERREALEAAATEARRISQSAVGFYERVDADLRIARRIQRSCRPAHLPAVERARFAVSHRSRSGSGGDFYNVTRADERHVAFFLGDVMGGSLTACLLSIFIHQNVVAKEIRGNTYRLAPPDEVLHKLNRDLAGLGLADPPLVRLTYGLLNGRSGELQYACAGHTPPLYVPSQGELAPWKNLGPMLGAADSRYTVCTFSLRPGDRVLLFTDGLRGTAPEDLSELLAVAERHRDLPLAALGEALTQDLLTQTPEPDDFTMLGVEYQ